MVSASEYLQNCIHSLKCKRGMFSRKMDKNETIFYQVEFRIFDWQAGFIFTEKMFSSLDILASMSQRSIKVNI